MKYSILTFLILLWFDTSYSQSERYEKFREELSSGYIKKLEENNPYSISKATVIDYRFYPYYKLFGNSGICIQYKPNKEDWKQLKKKFDKYQKLSNLNISYNEDTYSYSYNHNNLTVDLPELNEEFGQLSSFKLPDRNVNIYLIEKGKLENVYVGQEPKLYNYFIGIYHFQKENTFVYWFLLY